MVSSQPLSEVYGESPDKSMAALFQTSIQNGPLYILIYSLYYLLEEDTIDILRILYGKRDVKRILERVGAG